jgi:ribonuclease III
MDENYSVLEKNIHYEFTNKHLLTEALCHSSYVNEQCGIELKDNERLEFLGDAVVNLVIGHKLMARHPHINEGELSKMRAHLVNEYQLANIARKIDLGQHIKLGKGEFLSRGHEKNSILADAFEALIAAIYLDGGFQQAFNMINNHFAFLIDSDATPKENFDYKTQLQELVQYRHGNIPRYKIIAQNGPDHNKTFKVALNAGDLIANGTGKSKKMAEQDAAKNALQILKESNRQDNDKC